MIFEMMTESGVILLLHTLVVDVVKEGDGVTGVVVENANGRNILKSKVVIDCTGEGDIAARAGCDWELAPKEQIQPHSLAFTMGGIDWEEFLAYIRLHPERSGRNGPSRYTTEEGYEMLRGFTPENVDEIGEIQGWKTLMNEALANGDWHHYSGVGFYMAPRPDVGVVQAHMQHSSQIGELYTHDAWDLTQIEIICRQQCKIAINFFKKYMPGFKKAYVTRICNEARLREGRRILCDHYLTSEEVVDGARFTTSSGEAVSPWAGTMWPARTHLPENRAPVWSKTAVRTTSPTAASSPKTWKAFSSLANTSQRTETPITVSSSRR
jgi:hypothetical protein